LPILLVSTARKEASKELLELELEVVILICPWAISGRTKTIKIVIIINKYLVKLNLIAFIPYFIKGYATLKEAALAQ